jgi:predicted CoA-binding protein
MRLQEEAMDEDAAVPKFTKPDPVLDVRKREILGTPRVIAIVGMSPKEDRPSHEVGVYLREHGHQVIPVHPKATEVAGLAAYPDLPSIPSDANVEIVDLFIRGDLTGPVVEQAAKIGAAIVWFQPGAENEDAERRAAELGLEVFAGVCPKAEHERLFGG